jgi:transcriptional regulator with XRE-family HTH domain
MTAYRGRDYAIGHKNVRKVRGVAREQVCEHCGVAQASDWATIHGRDGLSSEDYMPLCRSCHKRYDVEIGSLLRASDVLEIRDLLACNLFERWEIAWYYHVSEENIRAIQTGRNWSWL